MTGLLRPSRSWPRPTSPCDLVPLWVGEFRDKQDWINHATHRLTGCRGSMGEEVKAICVDTLGRRCNIGADFSRAEKDGTYPIRYFFECVPREILSSPSTCDGEVASRSDDGEAIQPNPEPPLPDTQLENGGACS